jgi:mannopine transport system permease protein
MAVGYAVLAFLLLPTMLVVPMSFGRNPYLEFPPAASRCNGMRPISPIAAGWTPPCSAPHRRPHLARIDPDRNAASLALVRGRLRGRPILELFIIAPVIIPTIVIAIASFLFFARLQLIGNLLAFVLAHTVLAVPYVVLSVSASLARVDADLDLAAMGLGASRPEAFARVTLPLILPGRDQRRGVRIHHLVR